MDNKELIKKILDEWHSVLSADLVDRGAAWMSDQLVFEFAAKYPNINKFGEFLSDLEDEVNG